MQQIKETAGDLKDKLTGAWDHVMNQSPRETVDDISGAASEQMQRIRDSKVMNQSPRESLDQLIEYLRSMMPAGEVKSASALSSMLDSAKQKMSENPEATKTMLAALAGGGLGLGAGMMGGERVGEDRKARRMRILRNAALMSALAGGATAAAQYGSKQFDTALRVADTDPVTNLITSPGSRAAQGAAGVLAAHTMPVGPFKVKVDPSSEATTALMSKLTGAHNTSAAAASSDKSMKSGLRSILDRVEAINKSKIADKETAFKQMLSDLYDGHSSLGANEALAANKINGLPKADLEYYLRRLKINPGTTAMGRAKQTALRLGESLFDPRSRLLKQRGLAPLTRTGLGLVAGLGAMPLIDHIAGAVTARNNQ